MKSRPGLLCTLALASVLAIQGPGVRAQISAPAPVVTVRDGQLRGEAKGGLWIFKGIPYAAPPVGDLRWRPPQPAAPWSGVRAATEFGFDCEQTRQDWEADRAKAPMSEDCLTLNIWTPKVRPAAGLPVMVWLHGGGYNAGTSAQAIYDGSALAARGVVLVTLNYRLGRFGFFAHPALTREAEGGPTGDFGFMDQIAALAWVKANIAAFGGDPQAVTLFGQSAGGGGVNAMMLAPKARGLFQRAIVQSGGGRESWPNLATAEAKGQAFAVQAGVSGNDAAALRRIPADVVRGHMTLIHTEAKTFSGPMVDGRLLAEDVPTGFAAEHQAPVPYMVGANDDEIQFAPWLLRPLLTAVSSHQLGADQPAVRAAYGSPAIYRAHLTGDLTFVEPARFLATQTCSHQSWLYSFAYVPQAKRHPGAGAGHAFELPFVFGALPELGVKLSADDRAMADRMQAYWVAFARTGKPDDPAYPAWPRFDPQAPKLMEFGWDGSVLRSARSAAMEALAAYRNRTKATQAPPADGPCQATP